MPYIYYIYNLMVGVTAIQPEVCIHIAMETWKFLERKIKNEKYKKKNKN